MIARARSSPPVPASDVAAARDPPARRPRLRAGPRSTPVSATATARDRGPWRAPPRLASRARRGSPARPVAALALPELTTQPAIAARVALARGTPAPARRRPRCGSGAAPRQTSGASQRDQPEVGRAAALQPAGDAGRPEARRQPRRIELLDAVGRLDPPRAKKVPVAAVIRAPRPPRARASGSGSGPPVPRRPSRGCRSPRRRRRGRCPSSSATWIRHRFVSRTSRTPGGASTSSTNGSPRVAVRVGGAQLIGTQLAGEAHVAAREQPLVERQQVGDEGHRRRPLPARPAPARSPACAGGPRRRRG